MLFPYVSSSNFGCWGFLVVLVASLVASASVGCYSSFGCWVHFLWHLNFSGEILLFWPGCLGWLSSPNFFFGLVGLLHFLLSGSCVGSCCIWTCHFTKFFLLLYLFFYLPLSVFFNVAVV